MIENGTIKPIIIPITTDFKLLDWESMSIKLTEIFRLTDSESENLKNSKTAQLIAAIPFAAGCKQPERSAFGNLCLYLAEKQSITGPGDHCPEDDVSIYERLRPLMNLEDGNFAVITHGMQLLALVMINGYKHSKENDIENGIYNPLNAGIWNFEQLKEHLISEIQAHPCTELDKIIPTLSYFIW